MVPRDSNLPGTLHSPILFSFGPLTPPPPPPVSHGNRIRPPTRLSATKCTLKRNIAGYEIDNVNNGDTLLGGGAVRLDSFSNASFESCNFSDNTGAVSRGEDRLG